MVRTNKNFTKLATDIVDAAIKYGVIDSDDIISWNASVCSVDPTDDVEIFDTDLLCNKWGRLGLKANTKLPMFELGLYTGEDMIDDCTNEDDGFPDEEDRGCDAPAFAFVITPKGILVEWMYGESSSIIYDGGTMKHSEDVNDNLRPLIEPFLKYLLKLKKSGKLVDVKPGVEAFSEK
jgi:hypothetical protein